MGMNPRKSGEIYDAVCASLERFNDVPESVIAWHLAQLAYALLGDMGDEDKLRYMGIAVRKDGGE